MKIYNKNDCCGETCERCKNSRLTPVMRCCDDGYIILFDRSSAGVSYKAKNGRIFDV